MTLIECFTKSHIDNISACLRLKPEKLIFVGNAEDMRQPVARYEKLLRQRGLRTRIVLYDACCKDILQLYQILYKVISREAECTIDLTGGDEAVIMAMGAVLSALDEQKRKTVRIERFDHRKNAVIDCVRDNCFVPGEEVQITVEELVAIHGGSVYPYGWQPPEGCSYTELDGLWRVVSDAPKNWNFASAYLKEFESRSQSRDPIVLPMEQLWKQIPRAEKKEPVVQDLLEKLQRYGVIQDRSSRDVMKYSYRSEMLRYCTEKAGNALETKTLLEGLSVTEKGRPFFSDGKMGVSIDWDGVRYHPENKIPETSNEIDVVLMRGTVPLFISCKNGSIDSEELYKLNTVASRFGGPYARKILIATHLDKKSPSANRAFVQRAWDMDIFLVTDAADLTHQEWQELFKKAME